MSIWHCEFAWISSFVINFYASHIEDFQTDCFPVIRHNISNILNTCTLQYPCRCKTVVAGQNPNRNPDNDDDDDDDEFYGDSYFDPSYSDGTGDDFYLQRPHTGGGQANYGYSSSTSAR